MEFYLVDDLECDLTIFHPYRTLMTLCRKEGTSDDDDAEAGELGVGIESGPRYWGTGDGQLELQEGALQMAWCVPQFLYFGLTDVYDLGSSSMIPIAPSSVSCTRRIL
jgi:hypothetical protein